MNWKAAMAQLERVRHGDSESTIIHEPKKLTTNASPTMEHYLRGIQYHLYCNFTNTELWYIYLGCSRVALRYEKVLGEIGCLQPCVYLSHHILVAYDESHDERQRNMVV